MNQQTAHIALPHQSIHLLCFSFSWAYASSASALLPFYYEHIIIIIVQYIIYLFSVSLIAWSLQEMNPFSLVLGSS